MSHSQRAARSRASDAGTAPARRGPSLGPVRVTPARAFLATALVGGLAFVAWSLVARDANQVPMMATGFAVLGIVMGIVAVMSVGRIVSAGREGHDGLAVLTALVGGLAAAAALLLLAGAAILSLIWSGTKSS